MIDCLPADCRLPKYGRQQEAAQLGGAVLEVEYVEEEGFDEALMEKLAADSLAREEDEEGKDDDVVSPPVPAPTEEVTKVETVEVVESAEMRTANSKEEDLELTQQVIMDYVNSNASDDGVVDDDDEE